MGGRFMRLAAALAMVAMLGACGAGSAVGGAIGGVVDLVIP